MGANIPPPSGIRVRAEDMHTMVRALFERAGTSHRDAELLAELLVRTDLRGVFSHGTRQTPGYVRLMLAGRVNPQPRVRVVAETATTRVLDGDGGMGHLPCYQGARWAAERAAEYGTAAATTRNHFHFGSAGKYSRLALEHDCIGMALSSHRYAIDAQSNPRGATGGSPLSIALPSGEQPPLVLDMASRFMPWSAELFSQVPWAFFKELGLGAVAQALGGILAGIYRPEFQAPASSWNSNQGAFIAFFSVQCFMPVEEFKREMDRYIGEVRRMRPFPGLTRAELPGGPEWQQERDYAREGIPISPEHQQSLEEIAGELEVETPFARCEHTRFGP